ncbi:membrane protein [Nitrospira sp.]|nr:membrane protein [Nitrospira sp.]
MVYSGSFHGDFQFDDYSTILNNPHYADWSTFVEHVGHIVRPVLSLTFLVDRTLYGSSPTGYHILNLLLHLGSGILVYLILTRAVVGEGSQLPVCTALLFLIHPLQTETVTYISGRASGLMAFLYLLAFFLYVKASESQHDENFRRIYLSGAVVAGLLAISSKETAVTLPMALALWDVLIRRLQGPSLREAFLSSQLPFWILLVFAGGWAWSHPRYSYLVEFSFQLRPVLDNVLSEAHAIVYALLLFVSPSNQNFDHDLPELHSLVQWPLPFDLLVIGILLAATILMARRLPLFSFGTGWFLLQLLPTSLVPRADLLSERNLYLASIGLFLAFIVLAAAALIWCQEQMKPPRLVSMVGATAALVVVVGLCTMTAHRNTFYRDQLALWSDTVTKSPHKARPHNNLGHAYALEGEWDRAIDEFRLAVQLDHAYVLAQSNLRHAYLHRVGRE